MISCKSPVYPCTFNKMANKGWPRSKYINRAEDFSECTFEHINIYNYYSYYVYTGEVDESNTKITIV